MPGLFHSAALCHSERDHLAGSTGTDLEVALRVGTGPGIGPAPAWSTSNALTQTLQSLAGSPAPAARGNEVEVESGLAHLRLRAMVSDRTRDPRAPARSPAR